MALFVIDDCLSQLANTTALEIWKQGTRLTLEDRLLVNANAKSTDLSRRSSCDGLKELDGILADPEQILGGVAIVSFESRNALVQRTSNCPSIKLLEPEGAICFKQLPFPLDEVDSFWEERQNQIIWGDNQWEEWVLRLEASTRILHITNSVYRHDHKSLIAAVRIYLGALQAGDFDLNDSMQEAKVSQTLTLLSALSGNKAISITPDQIIERCKRHRILVDKVLQTSPPAPEMFSGAWSERIMLYEKHQNNFRAPADKARDFKLLMLDDQYDKLGWEPVINDLLEGRGEALYAKDWSSAASILAGQSTTLGLMLLDCNLGETQSTGLELLAPLRAFSLDLPITMMTAYDNAELALWALRAGCNDFYAKELDDKSDRDSLDYYCRFVDLMKRPHWEAELRLLWRDFEGRISSMGNLKADEAHIRYAFYLMFSLADNNAWWLRGATNIGRKKKDIEGWGCRAAILSIIATDNINLPTYLNSTLTKARHFGSITPTDALKVLKGVINIFPPVKLDKKALLKEPPLMPSGCRIERDVLVQNEDLDLDSKPSLRTKLGHLERSRLGAVQLVLGHLVKNGIIDESDMDFLFKESARDVHDALELLQDKLQQTVKHAFGTTFDLILIDDEGQENGWFRALTAVLGCNIYWYPTIKDWLDVQGSAIPNPCVILLDLWLADGMGKTPAAETGIQALESIKNINPGIPIIVLSAATDTVNAIKCMKRGALDYFSKWLPMERDINKWKKFYISLIERIEAGGKLANDELRLFWSQYSEIIDSPKNIGNKSYLLKDIKDWPTKTSTNKGRLKEIRDEYCQYLLPALVLYHKSIVAAALNGEIPPLDTWRVRNMLQSRESADEDIILFAGRAAEFLGRIRYCLVQGKYVGKKAWGNSGMMDLWIERASPKAKKIWKERIKVKDGNTKPINWTPNAKAVLVQALEAIRDFEQRIVNEEQSILNARAIQQ